jgi:hypothetical protein
MRTFLGVLSALTALVVSPEGLVSQQTSVAFARPIGIQSQQDWRVDRSGRQNAVARAANSPADTVTKPSKQYHGLRWTMIGAGVGAVVGGGASAYVVALDCGTGESCRGAWRYVLMGAGVSAIVLGFFTGLVYGLFNG